MKRPVKLDDAEEALPSQKDFMAANRKLIAPRRTQDMADYIIKRSSPNLSRKVSDRPLNIFNNLCEAHIDVEGVFFWKVLIKIWGHVLKSYKQGCDEDDYAAERDLACNMTHERISVRDTPGASSFLKKLPDRFQRLPDGSFAVACEES